MELKDFNPGDQVWWFKKIRAATMKVPGVVKYRKNAYIAVEITDISGTRFMKYVCPENLQKIVPIQREENYGH